MISKYKAILFDAGGTLLYPYPSVGEIYAEVAEEHGQKFEASDLNRAFREVWKKHDGMSELQSYTDEKVERDWWKKLVFETFEEVGSIKKFDEFFDRLYHHFASPECWRLYPEVIEVLNTLQKRNVPLAIVSNWDSRLLKLCELFRLTPFFEFILASAVFGSSKPNAEIFHEATNRLGIKPEEAVHIGDSLVDDVGGAKKAGVNAIFLDHHDEHQGSGKDYPVVRDLRELI